MRDHGSIAPAFWSGATGRKLRKNKDARILMTYYMTGPSAHALGLYYAPVPTILHETGLTESEFADAGRFLAAEGAAFYDADREWVWVPKMAFWQLGEVIKPNDKRMPWIRRHLERFKGHAFYLQFLVAYGVPYCLAAEVAAISNRPSRADEKTLPGAVESLRTRQGQDQGQEEGQDQERESSPARDPGTPAPEPGPTHQPRPILAVAKPSGPTAYELMLRFGVIRSEVSEGVFLPWESPVDSGGKTAAWIAGLGPDAQADLEPAMRLALCNMRDQVRDWENPKFWQDVNLGFATFRARFTALREFLHGRNAAQKPPARASPQSSGLCSFHADTKQANKPAPRSDTACSECRHVAAGKKQREETEPVSVGESFGGVP